MSCGYQSTHSTSQSQCGQSDHSTSQHSSTGESDHSTSQHSSTGKSDHSTVTVWSVRPKHSSTGESDHSTVTVWSVRPQHVTAQQHRWDNHSTVTVWSVRPQHISAQVSLPQHSHNVVSQTPSHHKWVYHRTNCKLDYNSSLRGRVNLFTATLYIEDSNYLRYIVRAREELLVLSPRPSRGWVMCV